MHGVAATATVMERFILEMDGGLPLFSDEGRAISPLFTDPQETLEPPDLQCGDMVQTSAGTLAVTTQTIPSFADMVRTSVRTIPKKEKPKRIPQKCEHGRE